MLEQWNPNDKRTDKEAWLLWGQKITRFETVLKFVFEVLSFFLSAAELSDL